MRPACKLILDRAPVEAVTRQLSLALFTDAKLDLGHQARAWCATPGSGSDERTLASNKSRPDS
jgi:hypothetical protein